jgi:rRNA maturation endonuclease Nob1
LTEKIQEQKRFFCENCKREAFLQEEYCDQCGGKIEWPEQIQKIRNTWTTPKKKKHRFF